MTIKNIKTVTIANGESLSDAVSLGNKETIVAVELPSTYDQSPLTFLATGQNDLTLLKSVYVDGVEYTVSGIQNTFQALNPANILGSRLLQLRSGTSATPVNQSGARTIVLITAEL